MKLEHILRLAVEAGMRADPRSRKQIEREFKREDEHYAKMTVKEKEHYDHDRKWNPYLDSRILQGTGAEEVNVLMVGIDIETPEMLLAHELRRQGKTVDAILTHHPEGRALADLEKVVPVQIDLLKRCGVPETQAEGFLRPRMEKIWRSIHTDNLFRAERAAELLKFPLFSIHTPADNMAWRFVDKTICSKSFDRLEDVLNAINDVPEFNVYARKGNPPILVNGSKEGRAGKIYATEFTGGTNGPEELMKLQAQAGIGTVLSMHATEKMIEVAKEHHVNIIQCSHMASDTLGMNMILDEISAKERKLETVDVSGFVRVKRKR
jgi:putative NIF3 family GTP cyclohydrolase 1 type 2